MWIENYLSSHFQYVHCENVKSELQLVKFGVPQGSLLVPLLILIQINDLIKIVDGCTVQLYADDTVIHIEKIIHGQVQKYLDEKKILFRYQSGFHAHHSTDTCLSYLSCKILQGFEIKMFTGMILIDLHKAFDTIDHEIFLDKMACLGFSNSSISWFKSYLQDRSFTVIIGKEYSKHGNLSCGVPQGSILGPLIFLLYVGDMARAVDCDLLLYADDSCLILRDKASSR